jgi:hypothetical protein
MRARSAVLSSSVESIVQVEGSDNGGRVGGAEAYGRCEYTWVSTRGGGGSDGVAERALRRLGGCGKLRSGSGMSETLSALAVVANESSSIVDR